MRHVVNPAQCRAMGLPEVSFAASVLGMGASPRADAYLAGSGPPGGPLWFVIAPAYGQGVAALEPALRAQLPREAVSIVLSNAPLAGAMRPCLAATAGQGLARVAVVAALVTDPRACPQGLVLMAGCGANASAQPSLQAVLERTELRALFEGLALGDGGEQAAPQAPVPEAFAWVDLRGPGGVSRHPLVAARVVLGRSQGVAVPVFDPKVSRQHAAIERRAEGYVLRVFSSANGVSVDGELHAQGEFPLVDGSGFVMGDTAARVTVVPGRAPVPPSQRHPKVDAFFGALGMPSPPIPQGVYVAPTAEGVGTPGPAVPPAFMAGPSLSISWREGEGLRGMQYRWSSSTWSIAVDGATFGASADAARVRGTFLALGAALADAMTHEGALAPPGAARQVAVRATDASGATWTDVFGTEYASRDAHDALLEALTWRRASRL